jgi:hypothetical protein
MPEVRMTQTIEGSVDGVNVRTYREGETYRLPDDGPAGLAGVFVREGWAVPVEEPAPEPATSHVEIPTEIEPAPATTTEAAEAGQLPPAEPDPSAPTVPVHTVTVADGATAQEG